ncbi:MAG TPA: nuclear transport factor 2 family protein [Pirellulales bacterium]|jgi:hypothetical protein
MKTIRRLNKFVTGSETKFMLCAALLIGFASACARGADDPAKSTAKADGAKSDGAKTDAAAKADDPQTADVKKFIEKYFRTWTNQEMDAYGECFWPNAVVQYIDAQGNIETQQLREFLAAQRRFQTQRPGKEVPLKIEITPEKRLIRAVAYWKLDDGAGRTSYGYDHYTLLERDGKWRIANLTFYEVPPPK